MIKVRNHEINQQRQISTLCIANNVNTEVVYPCHLGRDIIVSGQKQISPLK